MVRVGTHRPFVDKTGDHWSTVTMALVNLSEGLLKKLVLYCHRVRLAICFIFLTTLERTTTNHTLGKRLKVWLGVNSGPL